ncbi:hypothetical protein JAAARDRAFT_42951 [Jaapia argillacea MUCL 33604]|uniref:Protein kinase domain-containing protein n=1 Tax=Jaapia argillacea MUCL 33604 TaxID=933084 RepID=A0A067P6D1_9AGAM|nr:hypothetical protein JAAARDRAFT_42951 [Jaapia argillacea MUCL 33604]
MMETLDISPHLPEFILRFWLSDPQDTLDNCRLHIYDTSQGVLAEARRIPQRKRGIFHIYDNGVLDHHCRSALSRAEDAFWSLEQEVEGILDQLISVVGGVETRTRLPISDDDLHSLRKYFIFLRYRNSDKYAETFHKLGQKTRAWSGHWVEYRPFQRVRRRAILGSFEAFLRHKPGYVPMKEGLYQDVYDSCWSLYHAEICFGKSSDGHQYLLPDKGLGVLGEELDHNSQGICHLFFPLKSTVTLYLLTNAEEDQDNVLKPRSSLVDCDIESRLDVHLRNAAILESSPRRVYFSSLRSAIEAASLLGSDHSAARSWDCNLFKTQCRTKMIQESLKKTLIVRESIKVTDLTDDIVYDGDSPFAFGSFADIWKGEWIDRVRHQTRPVALKVLRQIMVKGIKEKLLTRLKDEILAWHRLRHPNILQFYGVVQKSNTIAMVSPWCNNGTVIDYLKDVCPDADRMKLVVEIASGVQYLHSFKPIVVHGDLKGCNILIDNDGKALITDFGLSKVMEDFCESHHIATSFFGGSTRWMAPEIVLALIEDEDVPPPITTHSDVYAFGSVCLEIATDQVPYPNRTKDHAIIFDIMRGVKPARGAHCLIRDIAAEAFWNMLEMCWNSTPTLRPPMSEVTAFFLELRKKGSG